MKIIYYTNIGNGYLRALKKVDDSVYEPVIFNGKSIERKTVKGLINALCKCTLGMFGVQEI